MKKCASCSKDLPDAALHCVFCGAKQSPAPAQQAGLAKTVMGNFSAQELLAQMRQPGSPGVPPANLPSAAPYSPAPAQQPPAPVAPQPSPQPVHVASAPTMFDTSAAARPGPQPGPGAPRGNVDATMMPQGFNANAGAFNPNANANPHPNPQAPRGNLDATMMPQNYNAAAAIQQIQAQAAAQAAAPPHAQDPGHGPAPGPALGGAQVFGPSSGPIPQYANLPAAAPAPTPGHIPPTRVPGADPLRGVGLWSLLFGILLVLYFVTPLSLSPLTFSFAQFGTIFDQPVGLMLIFLIIPVIGVLAILFGLLPMGTAAKGAAAGALGIAGLAIFLAFADHVEWQHLASELGIVVLLAGLVIRGGYPSSLVARILVTIGALAVLAPELIPVGGGGVPLVAEFQALSDLPVMGMVTGFVGLFRLVLVIAALLAWLPGPGGGGAKIFYWGILVTFVASSVIHVVDASGADAFQTPAALLEWAPMVALYGLASYGIGALLGKTTE